MKKIQRFIALAGLMLLVAACHFGGRSTTIIESANGNSVKIVYHGQTYFTRDGKGIKFISPNGSVTFSHNSQNLVAENDHGRIVYEINGGGKQTQLDEDGKAFLARAVTEMMKRGHNADK
ncbi:hypothetical protein [Mucilaginibacter sp. FT3.2]|uniref:hypothetical protein n=1 Tax=Mucilaginibacter sp. FT3.2 TaxID=2723090 RepID=UPI00160E11F7|nr:hypothetical protein [Mucilaginibacter sp. FT3.2]MBB6231467.1 hypothetical protein [Mucilaginibacter sp. FT3.2]